MLHDDLKFKEVAFAVRAQAEALGVQPAELVRAWLKLSGVRATAAQVEQLMQKVAGAAPGCVARG